MTQPGIDGSCRTIGKYQVGHPQMPWLHDTNILITQVRPLPSAISILTPRCPTRTNLQITQSCQASTVTKIRGCSRNPCLSRPKNGESPRILIVVDVRRPTVCEHNIRRRFTSISALSRARPPHGTQLHITTRRIEPRILVVEMTGTQDKGKCGSNRGGLDDEGLCNNSDCSEW